MSARRTEIRNALRAALTGLPTTGDNVFVSRSRPLKDDALPGLLIYSGEQESLMASLSTAMPAAWRWKLYVVVLVKDGVDAEAVADQIVEEIKGALFASPAAMTLGGQVSSLSLEGIEAADLDDSLDKPAVRLPLIFEAIYS